jgi:hypothetical protein
MKKTIIIVAIMGIFAFVGLIHSAQSATSPQGNALYQLKAKGMKLKVSVKKKTKKSSIKVSGKTGKYFAVIISVNGQDKSTLTSNKKGAFKVYVPLDIGMNTISVRAINGTDTKTITKRVKNTGKIIANPTPSTTTPALDQTYCLAYNQFSENASTVKFLLSTAVVQRSKSECDLISQKNDRSKEIVSDHNSAIDNINSWENNCLFNSLIYTTQECFDISLQNKMSTLIATLASINNLWGTDRTISYN